MTEQEWKNRMTNPKYNELQITTHVDNKPYVFISYKSDSWELVLTEIVYTLQKKYGLRVYFDKSFNDNNNIWTEQFPENMSDPYCKAVISFVDNEYYLSYATLLEVMYSQTYQAALGTVNEEGLPVIPVNLESIKKVSMEIGKKNTGLGVETFVDGTKNFNARSEKDLFDCTFSQLKERGFWKKSQYIYDGKSLTKDVCSVIMGEMFSFLKVSENPYKPNMIEFYESLVKTIKSVAPDVFDDVSNNQEKSDVKNIRNVTKLDWDDFNDIKAFSYNENVYNVSDAQNAYIKIVDVLHSGDGSILPEKIIQRLPKYVKFADGKELNIPKRGYEKILEPIIKDKITLYAESFDDGSLVTEYTILSRDIIEEKKETVIEEVAITDVETIMIPDSFTDSLCCFARAFSKLYDMKNAIWKERNNVGRMPSIDIDVTINFNCEYLEHYYIREHSLKKMFTNIIEYFYQMSGKRYFDYAVELCGMGKTKSPMIINDNFVGDKKLYTKIKDSEYFVYNNYSAKEIFVYMNKHVEMYFGFLKEEGISVDVSDVVVDYKISDKNDASIMQKIREQGGQMKSTSVTTSGMSKLHERCVTFNPESFVDFVKRFEKVSDDRKKEYKEKQMGNAPSIPFYDIVLYLPDNVANVSELCADSWQALFKLIIDTLDESSKGEYCQMRTELEEQKKVKVPKFVLKDNVDKERVKNYQLCSNEQYYYYKWYSSLEVLKEISKELSLYMNYFADRKGIQDDITSVRIAYKLPEDYAELFA